MNWSPRKWLADFKAAQAKRAEAWAKAWDERKWLVRSNPARRRRKYAFHIRGQQSWWLVGHMPPHVPRSSKAIRKAQRGGAL